MTASGIWLAVAWFAGTGIALFLLAHLYAAGLIAAARYPAVLKNAAASILYVGFGCALVGPLFAAIWFQRENGTLFTASTTESVFVIGGFAISVIPGLYVVLVKRMAALRAAGWFLSET
jgi:hypothetical protein